LRRRNFIKPERMPHATPLGLTYDSGDFARNMDRTRSPPTSPGCRRGERVAEARGRYRGLGHAVYIEQVRFPPTNSPKLRFDRPGTLTPADGHAISGQGHQTAIRQLAAERLGLPLDKIRVLQGDTAAIGFRPRHRRSRSHAGRRRCAGAAADKLIDKAQDRRPYARRRPRADIRLRDGGLSRSPAPIGARHREVARRPPSTRAMPAGRNRLCRRPAFTPPQPTFPNGCHVCEVEIDPKPAISTFCATVVRRFRHGASTRCCWQGQVHGGSRRASAGDAGAHRIRSGERTIADRQLTDYAMPAAETCRRSIRYNVVPCRTNPLGVKGRRSRCDRRAASPGQRGRRCASASSASSISTCR
jgi:carbon-monoxide dehydrogenase large subunit